MPDPRLVGVGVCVCECAHARIFHGNLLALKSDTPDL